MSNRLKSLCLSVAIKSKSTSEGGGGRRKFSGLNFPVIKISKNANFKKAICRIDRILSADCCVTPETDCITFVLLNFIRYFFPAFINRPIMHSYLGTQFRTFFIQVVFYLSNIRTALKVPLRTKANQEKICDSTAESGTSHCPESKTESGDRRPSPCPTNIAVG